MIVSRRGGDACGVFASRDARDVTGGITRRVAGFSGGAVHIDSEVTGVFVGVIIEFIIGYKTVFKVVFIFLDLNRRVDVVLRSFISSF